MIYKLFKIYRIYRKYSLTSFYQCLVYWRYLLMIKHINPWSSIVFHRKAPSYFIKLIFHQQTIWLFLLFLVSKDSSSKHPWIYVFLQLPNSFQRISVCKLNFWIENAHLKIWYTFPGCPKEILCQFILLPIIY